MDLQTYLAAVLHQAALDDSGEKSNVNVATGHDGNGSLLTQTGLVMEQCGQRRCSCPFRQRFFLFQKSENSAGDFFLDTETTSSTYFSMSGSVMCPARRTAMPSAIVGFRGISQGQ